jgi:hypothetical protein
MTLNINLINTRALELKEWQSWIQYAHEYTPYTSVTNSVVHEQEDLNLSPT